MNLLVEKNKMLKSYSLYFFPKSVNSLKLWLPYLIISSESDAIVYFVDHPHPPPLKKSKDN